MVACLGLLVGAAMVVRSQDVVINEIMYHPASENLRESYIELYNPGTLETDLSGWRFTKGLPFVFPTNTMLGPGGLPGGGGNEAFRADSSLGIPGE